MAVITIARQFGAGGKTMGQMVADKLGYTLIDEEIVEMIATEANVSKEDVATIADQTETDGFLTRLVHKLGPFRKGYVGISMEQNPGYIDGDLYISLLYRVIPQIAAHDNVIIIGRGSQYILANHPKTYHFLLIADMEHRLAFIMKYYDIDRDKAKSVIEQHTKRRANLYHYLAKSDYDQPHLYHMVFNMNRVTLEDAAESVCGLVAPGSKK